MKRWKAFVADPAPANTPLLAWLHAPDDSTEIHITVIMYNTTLGQWVFCPQGGSTRKWAIEKWCEIEMPLEKGELAPVSPETIGIVDYLDKKIP